MKYIGLGVIMLSEKTKEMIATNLVDLLIDGPFIESQVDTGRVLLGSKKNLVLITSRYFKMVTSVVGKISIGVCKTANNLIKGMHFSLKITRGMHLY